MGGSRSLHCTLHKVNLMWFIDLNILPLWHSGKESTCQCRSHQEGGFVPWVRKSPGIGNQPTPVFLPVKFQGQKSLVGYSPWNCKELA